jgi:Flp pilus assembly protein TadG
MAFGELTELHQKADVQIVAVCRSAKPKSPTGQAQKGFVLIVTAISMTLLLGLAGLAIDIGRMYVIRAELQSFTDAAALSAALELNGTDSGIARARTGAGRLANGPHAMRWDMGTQPITNITTSFSSDRASWQERPKQAANFRFVRVVASQPAPVIFLRIFQPLTSTTIAAASVAAKTDASARLVQ